MSLWCRLGLHKMYLPVDQVCIPFIWRCSRCGRKARLGLLRFRRV